MNDKSLSMHNGRTKSTLQQQVETEIISRVKQAKAALQDEISSLRAALQQAEVDALQRIKAARAPLWDEMKALRQALESAEADVPLRIKRAKAPLQSRLQAQEKELQQHAENYKEIAGAKAHLSKLILTLKEKNQEQEEMLQVKLALVEARLKMRIEDLEMEVEKSRASTAKLIAAAAVDKQRMQTLEAQLHHQACMVQEQQAHINELVYQTE